MTRQPDFLDVVILQGLCLTAGAEDAFTLSVEDGLVTVTWSDHVVENASTWVELEAWFEVVCLPLQWEVIDTWGPWWAAEAEVGSESVVAERAGEIQELLAEATWTVPDMPPALIVCNEIDLVGVSQVV